WANVVAHARRDAEFRARRDRADGRRRQMRADGHDDIAIAEDPDVAAPEVGMHEISERLPASFGNLEALRERALELEGQTLVPIPETVAVFALAHQRGIPVVFVRVIYLTSEARTAVPPSAGLDLSLVDEVVTSLDHRCGKAHGLLDETIARRRVQPERVVHLGDNEIADVRTAERLGARVAHLDVPKRDHAVELVPEPLRNWSSASGTDLGISASVRATLVATRSGTDPSYQFGVATIGPALAGFGRWVSDTATDLGGSHVHCMLREGATIAELMRVVAPDGPTPVPLHVSRWVTMRAAVIDGSREQLLTSLSRRADLTAQHVVDAFGCELELVREVIGGDTVPAAEVDDACAALAAHDDARTAIIDGAAALRARVLTYLADRLEADDGPIVLSDVGWGGTIQEGLTRILRSGGDDRDVVGLYFAMSSAGEERVARGASMRSYLPNRFADPDAARDSRAVAHHADTIERIMTPAIGTLLDIDAAGAPITRSADHDHLPPSLVSAQRGMRDVVDTLADEDRGVTDFDDRRWHDPQLRAAFAATIARVVVAPDHRVASALGSWPHDDVAGTDHRAIADPRVAEAIPYANVHDVAQLDPNGRRWVSGLAGSRNRALVGQLDARHRMVDVDDLAPVGDLGVALLAAFEVGDNQARIQHAGPARQLPGGWTMLRLDGEVDSLRGLRFDAGEHTSFVDVDVFEVRLGTDDPGEIPRRSIRFDDSDVRIIGGHHFDGRSFVHRAGGHVLLDFDPDVAGRIRRIQVTVGFRAIRLADDSPLAITPIATRTKDQARRVAGAVRRRL
ncbi:MAG: HAD family hydrolase, partial [Ilumatobacter sp.]